MAILKITYNDKTYLNQNPSIADENKVKDTDMNEIKNVVNTSAENIGDILQLKINSNLVDAVNSLSIYSTTETKTNKIWINNKPIYRKVVTDTSIASSINTGITDYEDITKMTVLVRQSGSTTWRPIPWLFVQNNAIGTNWWAGGFYFSNGALTFQVGDSLKNIDKIIAIIEYTKTTD